MRKKLMALALVVAGLAFPAGYAVALVVAPPPGPTRIVNTDATFVGRVIELEPVDVEAAPFKGAKETVKYRIAVVKVNQVIRGLKAEKTIRVGFLPPMPIKPGVPRTGRGPGPQLQVGQEGLFMISKHPDGKFYQAPNFGYFVPSQEKNFDEEVKTAKKVVAIMANAKPALQSKDADERLMAASILIGKYRTQTFPGEAKLEPIDAEESKLILNALANAKWQPVRFGATDPWQLFNQLGINERDGFKQPQMVRGIDDLRDAVQEFVRANGDTYRIKRFVPQTERR